MKRKEKKQKASTLWTEEGRDGWALVFKMGLMTHGWEELMLTSHPPFLLLSLFYYFEHFEAFTNYNFLSKHYSLLG